jgi:hypothetical protein
MNIITKIVVALAIVWLLLQVGRKWGREEMASDLGWHKAKVVHEEVKR